MDSRHIISVKQKNISICEHSTRKSLEYATPFPYTPLLSASLFLFHISPCLARQIFIYFRQKNSIGKNLSFISSFPCVKTYISYLKFEYLKVHLFCDEFDAQRSAKAK